MDSVTFRLQFAISEIEMWAKKYAEEDDADALQAGTNIREGDYSSSNLERIVRWKSERRIKLIRKNSDSEIADALSLALSATEARSAFAVLMGLCGVGTPMASAILTAINPNRYTVVDYRAMEALGVPDADYTNLNFYLFHYLPECKRLAAEAGVCLRTLDRALWYWSWEKDQTKSETPAPTTDSA